MNKKYVSLFGIIVFLGAVLALLMWYGYLQRTASTGSFDQVFSSYSPQAGGGGGSGTSNTPGRVQNTAPAGTTTSHSTPEDTAPRTTSKRVADVPVGGGTDIVGTTVRYIDRTKGYIYQTDLTTGVSKRISNIVLPGAFDVRFTSADNAVVQTVDEHGAVVAHALTFTADGTATETAIPISIIDIATVPEDNHVYALARDDVGGAVLVSFPLPFATGTTPTQMWSSSLTNWRLRATASGSLVLTQKASNGIPGYSYLFTPKTKQLEKLVGDTPGLQTLMSPSGAYLLTTRVDGEEIHTRMLTLATGKSIDLPRVTLPDKCVWEMGNGTESALLCGFPKQIPQRDLPDIWYQGNFIFDDILGRVDLATGAITDIDTHLDAAADMTDLRTSADGTTLIFTDKSTGTLWTVHHIR